MNGLRFLVLRGVGIRVDDVDLGPIANLDLASEKRTPQLMVKGQFKAIELNESKLRARYTL